MKQASRKLICHLLPAILTAIFIITTANAQTEHILHRFTSIEGDGAIPEAALISDAAGNLYGTTFYGGALPRCSINQVNVGCGMVLMVSPPSSQGAAWKETLLHEFTGGPDGEFPSGPLVLDKAGNLYGATSQGGASSRGTIFELSPPFSPGGQWAETILWTFNGDDAAPGGTLVLDSQGNLYGTAGSGGGGGNCGTVFELTPAGNGGWTETILYAFKNKQDGCNPQSGLIPDSQGNFYGTTGSYDGTVFRLSPSQSGNWRKTTLHTFEGNVDGKYPFGAVTIHKGALYGTTRSGGDSGCGGQGCGTVFQITSAGVYSIIHRFVEDTTDGILPVAGLIADGNGNLYGTAQNGGGSIYCGSYGCGAIFELTPPAVQGGTWTETTLYSFSNFDGDGETPQGALLLDKRGVLFGTTADGGDGDCSINGSVGCGTVFALTK